VHPCQQLLPFRTAVGKREVFGSFLFPRKNEAAGAADAAAWVRSTAVVFRPR